MARLPGAGGDVVVLGGPEIKDHENNIKKQER